MSTGYIRAPKLGEYTASSKRISVDALRVHVPRYQAGDEAERKLMTETHDPGTVNQLETLVALKQITLAHLVNLANPLMIREIRTLLRNSLLSEADELFEVLYFAGISGFEKGLKKFEPSKISKSGTNYLFQWVTTYAKRELLALEAPLGISPNAYERFKKIAAVRRRLSEELGRPAKNEELYDFFQSGRADMKSKKGRLANSGKPSKANRAITLELIEEQEEIERRIKVELLDPLGDYASDAKMSTVDPEPFNETLFGVFLDSYSFTPEARAVLQSELQYSPTEARESVASTHLMPNREYKRYVRAWTSLLRDPKGEFYEFVTRVHADSASDFDDVNLPAIISSIENVSPLPDRTKYDFLFEDE